MVIVYTYVVETYELRHLKDGNNLSSKWEGIVEWSRLLTVEMIVMGVILLVVLFTGIIILVKMRPLKNFDEVKFGSLVLKKGKDDIERDKKQDESLNKLLEFVESIRNRLNNMEGRFDEMDKRMDKMDNRSNIHYQYIKEAVIAGHKASLWGDQAPPFPEVMHSGLMMIMLGQDGNVITRMRECIMGFGKNGVKTYQSVLNNFINENKEKLEGNKHFEKHIEMIRNGIY